MGVEGVLNKLTFAKWKKHINYQIGYLLLEKK